MKGKTVREKIANLLLTPFRKNPGTEEELKALGSSYLKRPVHPIIVRPDLKVAEGNRRIMGLSLLGETEVTVFITEENLTDLELKEICIATSIHRSDLTDFDKASILREWLQVPGILAKDIAVKLDLDPSMISRLGSLWKTIPSVIAAAEEGKIRAKAWHKISLLPQEDQQGLLNYYLSGMTEVKIDIEMKKRAAKQTNSDFPKLSRVKCPLGTTGITVTVSGPEMNSEQYLNALTQAREMAMKASKESLDLKTAMRVWADKAKASS